MRRGQITLFIIIGIIILAAVGVLLLFSNRDDAITQPALLDAPLQFRPATHLIESCIDETTRHAIDIVALQGGYLSPPEDSLRWGDTASAYGYIKTSYLLPSKARMEEEIEAYLPVVFYDCIDQSLTTDFTLTAANISTDVTIQDDQVMVDIVNPLHIAKGDSLYETDRFTYTVDIPLGSIHSAISGYLRLLTENPGRLNFGYFERLGIDASIDPHNETDYLLNIYADDMVFATALKLSINHPPHFELEDQYVIADGETFTMSITYDDPDGDTVTFNDDTSLFDIASDGRISFLAESPGEYPTSITAVDDKGGRTRKTTVFIVQP